ncbi:hypothetical protein CA13_23460 [Planctomycetes bacterium CA13]|uniref:Uncharacterized protein n=1 Tax=Novipirellula herctigrandis TaxID=2527986 RepID=A0A5C5Z151_9BACT|nr:hypothetical protein CA13_23460 [Planctomycetes bacterium CA13]
MERGIWQLVIWVNLFTRFVNLLDFRLGRRSLGLVNKVADQQTISVHGRFLVEFEETVPLFGGSHDRHLAGGDGGEAVALVQIGKQVVAKLFVQMDAAHLVSRALHQIPINFGIAHHAVGERSEPRTDRGIV